ncbi:LytR/AlgR family response regulator transcription factor [Flagellimonas sp. 2504JD1-5]
MILTTIVIDDSPVQQRFTCKMIENNQSLQLLDFFNDPIKGIEAVNRLRPDILFLDVEMPGLGGFDVLGMLEYDCQVILNSTRSQFAFQAFRYDKVKDFLTKPLKQSRFVKSVERVLKNHILKGIEKPVLSEYVCIEQLPKAS